jgi:hypothetical protein
MKHWGGDYTAFKTITHMETGTMKTIRTPTMVHISTIGRADQRCINLSSKPLRRTCSFILTWYVINDFRSPRMFSSPRVMLALGAAVVLAFPACLMISWKHDTVAAMVIAINSPGIFLVGRHFPPEGYPGESPLHVLIMVLGQALLWYLLFSLFQRGKN